MAEGTSFNENNVACRFYLSGTCNDGENCLFAHDRSRQMPDSVCRYYLKGKCIFGLNCRYDHILINEVSTAKIISSNEMPTGLPFSSHETKRINMAPKPCSYADVVKSDFLMNSENESERLFFTEICPLFAEGYCPFQDCQLIHGNKCELCQKAYLHPYNQNARDAHIEKCEVAIEKEMEYSFAIQRSLNITCGICMDVVLEKEPISERRFGILENCNHVYCLSCIRKWRRSRHYENNQFIDSILDPGIIRSCPECRISSDFIIPSSFFVDKEDEKRKLIDDYKANLSKKHCKYFKQGEGICPFGGSCFYLHAKPDGTKIDLPPIRRRQNADGQFDDVNFIDLWDFIEHREGNAIP